MALQVFHVLVNVNYFLFVLVNLAHEGLNRLGKLRIIFLDNRFILLVVLLDVSEELLEVKFVIQDKLVDYCLVELIAWELV
jgi:hypothetical protein